MAEEVSDYRPAKEAKYFKVTVERYYHTFDAHTAAAFLLHEMNRRRDDLHDDRLEPTVAEVSEEEFNKDLKRRLGIT